MLAHVHEAEHSKDDCDANLQDGPHVHEPCRVRRLREAHEDDSPDERKLYGERWDAPELDAHQRPYGVRKHQRERRHPQGEVHPIGPRDKARNPLAKGALHPIVHAALIVGVGRPELRDDHTVGQKERDDEHKPPEVLRVSDRRCRRCGLCHEYDADHIQNSVKQAESLCTSHGCPFKRCGGALLRGAPIVWSRVSQPGAQAPAA